MECSSDPLSQCCLFSASLNSLLANSLRRCSAFQQMGIVFQDAEMKKQAMLTEFRVALSNIWVPESEELHVR